MFDRVTARPGSVLLRDKKNPDIAIFSNVEQIKNTDFSWKPTLVDACMYFVARKCVPCFLCESKFHQSH